jgi:hypothetical protein
LRENLIEGVLIQVTEGIQTVAFVHGAELKHQSHRGLRQTILTVRLNHQRAGKSRCGLGASKRNDEHGW